MSIKSTVKAVLYRMNIIKGAKNALRNAGISELEDFYSRITRWEKIYSGDADWLNVNKTAIGDHGKRKMANFNAANTLCREFSALAFAEQCKINVADKPCNDYIKTVLQENGFWDNFPIFYERILSSGGGALSAYLEDGKIKIDYVRANRFLPYSWDNRRILNAGFVSQTQKNDMVYTLIRSEKLTADGMEVDHKLFEGKGYDDIGTEVPLEKLYPNVKEHCIFSGAAFPLFAYLKPNAANVYEPDCPLGVSIYSAAEDTLKALDVAFDSFSREFILGKRRIIVPAKCLRTVIDPETKQPTRYFDATDETYVAFNDPDAENLKIKDNTVALRIEEHVAGINALLNILCFQTGLSSGSLSFDGAGLKTATEVISQNSKTYRTKRTHQNMITEALEQLVHAIIYLGACVGAISCPCYDVTIKFDDGIVVDTNTKIDNHIKLVSAQLESKLRAVMDILGLSEEEAKNELQKIQQESTVTGTPDDWYSEDGGSKDDAGTNTGAVTATS